MLDQESFSNFIKTTAEARARYQEITLVAVSASEKEIVEGTTDFYTEWPLRDRPCANSQGPFPDSFTGRIEMLSPATVVRIFACNNPAGHARNEYIEMQCIIHVSSSGFRRSSLAVPTTSGRTISDERCSRLLRATSTPFDLCTRDTLKSGQQHSTYDLQGILCFEFCLLLPI